VPLLDVSGTDVLTGLDVVPLTLEPWGYAWVSSR
jgi:hypothetical protein